MRGLLPDALAHFYPRSFTNGESMIRAMEDRVGAATIFVLFASAASIRSKWVGFEMDRAKLAKIKEPNRRTLVFLIDPNVGVGDLPEWMREFWVPHAGRSVRDIARYIRNVLLDVAITASPLSQPVGRGAFNDNAIAQFQNRFLQSREMPNVFVFAGHTGIGRRTVKRKFLQDGFPATRELNFGPELVLPQFADSADLYRALREEIDLGFSKSAFEIELEAFHKLSPEEQAAEISANMAYFGPLGQAVTVVTGNGIYEDRGILKPWVPNLFTALSHEKNARLCIITNRQIHNNELLPHQNVLQFAVGSIADENIRTLMIITAQGLGIEPMLPSDKVIAAIGGHAGIARTATGLIAQIGVTTLNDNLRELFSAQDEVLRESLSFDRLSEIQKDILSVLSWVPQLNGNLVREIIRRRHNIPTEQFAEIVSELVRLCLMEASGANYLISSPIRSMFRRMHGYGSTELQKDLAAILRDEWERRAAADEFPTELFDAFVYMTALEGGTLPKEMNNLLMPSTLQEVVRETYDTGHDDDAALRRVVTWGRPAIEMKMDETAREEILSYVVRAQIRLGDDVGVKTTLDFIDSKAYRSRLYLRAFYIRFSGGNLNDAVDLLRKALTVRKYRRRVVADLALCYQRLGMWKELSDLIRDEGNDDDNVVLLDMKIGMLLAQNDFARAQESIDKLRGNRWDDGRADSRTAMLLMKRDQKYNLAKRMLTDVLQRRTGGHLAVRCLRAIAAAEDNDRVLAKQDIEYLRPRAGGHDNALRIEARLATVEGDYDGADNCLSKLQHPTAQDHLLRASMLERRAADIRTSLSERGGYREAAAQLRAKYRNINEFEIDR
ncbi:toll/interleukin-1 receptor domain-containing protein [Mesorhizobium australicum]